MEETVVVEQRPNETLYERSKRPVAAPTCNYCGVSYPGPYGSDILAEHIKGCDKSPMKKLERNSKALREALLGIFGVEDSIEELRVLDKGLQDTPPVHTVGKGSLLRAVRTLIETYE